MQNQHAAERQSHGTGYKIPTPAHPQKRREPLPWQEPKSAEDDPDAPSRVRAIMASASYREADQDVAFLDQPESRGVRLQIDYLKTELSLQRHRVEYTIVVFGSTRIREPGAALRRVNALSDESNACPDKQALEERLAVAQRILAKSHYYEIAREFGRLVGSAGRAEGDGRVMVMTGSGPGIMEAANRGAFDAGAQSIGLNIRLPHDQYPNPYITPDLCFRFHYFALRKLHFLQRARALVVFPGGYGTFDELFEVLALIQTRKIAPVPVILVGAAFWKRAFDVDFLVDEGVIDPEDRELFWHAETAREIWDGLLHWHETNGTPLFPPGRVASAID
jgi:uncharacterized protein (TIGR00730 family)